MANSQESREIRMEKGKQQFLILYTALIRLICLSIGRSCSNAPSFTRFLSRSLWMQQYQINNPTGMQAKLLQNTFNHGQQLLKIQSFPL